MQDDQLLRYSRHLLLNEFGVDAQARLLASDILVIGAGGLGAAALLYLASAGVGQITVADGDTVDLTNLQRQIIHDESRVGMNKAASAKVTIARLNSATRVTTIEARIAGAALAEAVATADVVLDCSDNFATRYDINSACVRHGKPLVSGAAIRFDGQVAVFDRRLSGAPCYHCLFPADAASDEERCAVMGVFAPLVGVVGTLQAQEAIKLVTGVGQTLAGRFLMVSALDTRFNEIHLKQDSACPVCAGGARPLSSRDTWDTWGRRHDSIDAKETSCQS